MLAFLDRPDISAGQALAALLRLGNAGSNTAADHITVLAQALAWLPARYRPTPAGPDRPDVIDAANAPKVLVRSDSAGATHTFAKARRDAGVGFSFGFAVTSPQRRQRHLRIGHARRPRPTPVREAALPPGSRGGRRRRHRRG